MVRLAGCRSLKYSSRSPLSASRTLLSKMVSAKEHGWVLSIDQASNCAGVSLWANGLLTATTTLNSDSPKDSFGKRLARQCEQLEDWLTTRVGKAEIKVVLFEGVRSRLVLCTVGAFASVQQLRNCKIHPRHSFVESTSWKNWARKRGATGGFKEIKGVKALRETGWDFDKFPVDSCDIADSLMIYMCWRDRA